MNARRTDKTAAASVTGRRGRDVPRGDRGGGGGGPSARRGRAFVWETATVPETTATMTVPGATYVTWYACGPLLHAAAAATATGTATANFPDDGDDWPWTRDSWYTTSVLLAECVSAVCVALALAAYACMLKQQDISNYVKHYLACLLATILVGIGGRSVPERFEPYYCTYPVGREREPVAAETVKHFFFF